MPQLDTDTICAIATAPGRGGIGIVRVSGPDCCKICKAIVGSVPSPRIATLSSFMDSESSSIDEGLLLYFPGPDSFTGEDVLELHAHGGPYILQSLLARAQELGARLARPGEFSERAFLNGKIDLLQAEAIADLIDASTQQAARSALRTLQGVFSARIHEIVEAVTKVRVNVEAAIDFSDEDIDVLESTGVHENLQTILNDVRKVFDQAEQGAMLKEGIQIVIAGSPNAGKSSLMNAFSGYDSAIVTDIPGTTRDILREQLSVDGLPVTLIDTAGLRASDDPVEREGVRRAGKVIEESDQIFLVIDGSQKEYVKIDWQRGIPESCIQPILELGVNDPAAFIERCTIVINKVDLIPDQAIGKASSLFREQKLDLFKISAKLGNGMELLRDHIKDSSGYAATDSNDFLARQRHLDALLKARELLEKSLSGVSEHLQLELVAEDLRLAQSALGEITGRVSSDDLLGEIFSNFCIGK